MYRPRQVFVKSLSDIGHARVPTEFVAGTFAMMALAPRHRFQVLTRRPRRLRPRRSAPQSVMRWVA
ncbi:DUF5131 family protein [Streptomyces sp. NPDC086033]|uniref:DUF5131 family protein n=1 Tax=Streptomyces sp. NPDC086033 TaxID=3365747 RepID=UPI0037D52B1B